MFFRVVALVAVAALVGTGCADAGAASPSGADEGPSVVAGFYPLAFVAAEVGGSSVRVTDLAPPGAEPHDLELKPRQVGLLADADLVVYLKGFQPAVDTAVNQQAEGRTLDVSREVTLETFGEDEPSTAAQSEEEHAQKHEEAGADPHVWLDPTRLATIATAVGEALAGVDPSHANDYRERARQLGGRLHALDAELRAGLTGCARTTIVTSHAAFGYLAQRYGLRQVAISGLDPEAEPTPRRIVEVAAIAKEQKVTTIFFERLVSPKVATVMARDLGLATAVLDPVEGLPAGGSGDYFSVMTANLAALRSALGCP